MLKVTPYLGIIVLIVSILGIRYPLLGYVLLLIFASLLAISPFSGRWFCGNLCPRGSFNDFWLARISRKSKMPAALRSLWLRIPVFVLLMGFMIVRIIKTNGTINKVGMVFVTMCIITTSIAIVFGIFFSPRAWCSFCPMGTVQRFLGGRKKHIIVDKKKCIKCGVCHNVCPMQLKVSEIFNNPDCIKCGRCITACPKKALIY
ncbi:4Fe-4S binding protein [Candidatus Woesearchaeota archaeon]|nr:4Fe-4S binding protein [Candidatus Woesearchaeota archaeon]